MSISLEVANSSILETFGTSGKKPAILFSFRTSCVSDYVIDAGDINVLVF